MTDSHQSKIRECKVCECVSWDRKSSEMNDWQLWREKDMSAFIITTQQSDVYS